MKRIMDHFLLQRCHEKLQYSERVCIKIIALDYCGGPSNINLLQSYEFFGFIDMNRTVVGNITRRVVIVTEYFNFLTIENVSFTMKFSVFQPCFASAARPVNNRTISFNAVSSLGNLQTSHSCQCWKNTN